MRRSCALEDLVAEIKGCVACAEDFARTPTAHAPRPVLRPSTTARVCVAGQAPGVRVHASGVPFNDPSGVRLRRWMGVSEAEFLDQSRIAILPMAFCFPGHDAKGGDLPPPKRCAALWRERLAAAHPQVELWVLVGAYAQRWHLAGRARSLTETVADWRAGLSRRDGPAVFPTPHPSWRNNTWLKKNPWFEAEAVPALQSVLRDLLQPPGTPPADSHCA